MKNKQAEVGILWFKRTMFEKDEQKKFCLIGEFCYRIYKIGKRAILSKIYFAIVGNEGV